MIWAMPEPGTVPSLLKDPDDFVRYAAADSLAKLGKPAVESLIARLNDRNWKVRRPVAMALGKLGDARAVEPLITCLKDKAENVRSAAAEALGEMASPRFLVAEFDGQFTASKLLEAISADGIEVPEALSELESLNNLLERHHLHTRFPHVALCQEAQDLIRFESTISHQKLNELNRLILEAAYTLKMSEES